jgi:hypothetical protein
MNPRSRWLSEKSENDSADKDEHRTDGKRIQSQAGIHGVPPLKTAQRLTAGPVR